VSEKLPLAGVRVVDLSWIVAGPTSTRILADFGAEVIKVESREVRDMIRGGAPFADGKPGINRSGFFNNLNRNKLGLALNLSHPSGLDILKRLIAISDVLVENFSSRVMEERWGLTYKALREVKPDIIYCSLSGYGHSGPFRDNTTWGPTAQAVSGLTLMSGLPGKEPAGWGYSFMDNTAGYQAALAVLAALHHRSRTGEGQWIDLSQVEGGIAMTGPYILDYTVNGRTFRRDGMPPGNRSESRQIAPHNTYRCKGEVRVGENSVDGRWCAIVCRTDAEFRALCAAMGQPRLADDARFRTNAERLRNEDALDSAIESWTRQHDPYEVMSRLQRAEVPCGVVQNAADKVEQDAQLKARGFFVEAEHQEAGKRLFEGVSVRLQKTPGSVRRGAPLLGGDNEYVLRTLLGVTDAEMEQLIEEAVI
jgi:crotonobetainyl-CoA:carnitine CoA-transferase CaiB-like acyl-CoA transferase